MARENVELVRSLHDAINGRDFARAVQHLDPEIEVSVGVVVDPGQPAGNSRLSGRDEVRRFLEDLAETWEAQWVEVIEIVEASADRVVMAERWYTRGRSGIKVDFDVVDAYAFRGGLIRRVDGFRSRTEALEAAWRPE
jgi:ketosteroid isomerase-like protein